MEETTFRVTITPQVVSLFDTKCHRAAALWNASSAAAKTHLRRSHVAIPCGESDEIIREKGKKKESIQHFSAPSVDTSN